MTALPPRSSGKRFEGPNGDAALIGLIALALLFDMSDGVQGSANAVATVVPTHVLHKRAPPSPGLVSSPLRSLGSCP